MSDPYTSTVKMDSVGLLTGGVAHDFNKSGFQRFQNMLSAISIALVKLELQPSG